MKTLGDKIGAGLFGLLIAGFVLVSLFFVSWFVGDAIENTGKPLDMLCLPESVVYQVLAYVKHENMVLHVLEGTYTKKNKKDVWVARTDDDIWPVGTQFEVKKRTEFPFARFIDVIEQD